jgi:Leucine-rich repeat (LRR) protein
VADCSHVNGDDVHDATTENLAAVFNSLPGTTKTIFLRGNKNITEISANVLSYLRDPIALKAIYFDGCRITSVAPGAFMWVPNLEVLSLNANQISSLDDRLLAPLENLKGFSIFFNLLTSSSYTANLFKQNKNLESVIMYGNKGINTLLPNLFDGLSKVHTISFVNCQLDNVGIPDDVFDPLVNLTRFDFFGNKIDHIVPRWFTQTTQIRRVVLWQNPLGSVGGVDAVPPGAFDNLKELQQVYLHDARHDPATDTDTIASTITFDKNTFDKNTKLQTLTLSNSNFKMNHATLTAIKKNKVSSYPTNYKVDVIY